MLFDLDGTLIDTIDMIRASMRYATETVLGAPLPDEVLMCNVGIPLRQQMAQFSEAHTDELLATYREHNGRVHDAMIKEYPGVEETLVALLERGLRLGIVTSKSRTVALRGLERFSLSRFFEVMVTCDDVDRFKPDPFPLRHAAEMMGVDIALCAYVGDSPHDMSAAVAAGCVSIAALWGAFSAESVLSPGPLYQAASMNEVLAIVSGHEGSYRVAQPTAGG
ncbi:MAG: HAD family hydrolase [Actinobacteria bacterium HGW-Actinobacteria-7]|jgi:pyrophosphatase PpaX|nr:MAG: HAD family hydrolase [Actinobacteria bacterium HGW-Actinobacteria-7]